MLEAHKAADDGDLIRNRRREKRFSVGDRRTIILASRISARLSVRTLRSALPCGHP